MSSDGKQLWHLAQNMQPQNYTTTMRMAFRSDGCDYEDYTQQPAGEPTLADLMKIVLAAVRQGGRGEPRGEIDKLVNRLLGSDKGMTRQQIEEMVDSGDWEDDGPEADVSDGIQDQDDIDDLLNGIVGEGEQTPNNRKTFVVVSLQVEGMHHWPTCPIEEVEYLKQLHRHVFHIKASKAVSHNDRDVEIIQLKHDMLEYLNGHYYNEHIRMMYFNTMSCEMIAHELLDEFELSSCEVLEDGENGAIVLA